MTETTPAVETPKKTRRSPWPYAIVAWLGFVIMVNGTVFYIASQNGPSMTEPNYYEKSLNHDKVQEARTASRALGWVSTLDTTDDKMRYTIKDKVGHAVTGLNGRITLRYAATTKGDRVLALVEVAPGIYEASDPNRRRGDHLVRTALQGGPALWLDEQTLNLK